MGLVVALAISLIGGCAALAPQQQKKLVSVADEQRPQLLQRRSALGAFVAAPLALALQPAGAVVYLDPARYGDQELKNAAIAKCRTRVRDAIVRDPSMAPRFFELALLDGLSYNEKTRKGGPDGTVAASIQVPGARYDSLREALEILRESQKALKRTNALTLADLIALAGAESVAAVGGPEISVQLGRTDSPTLAADVQAVKKGGPSAAASGNIKCAYDADSREPADIMRAFRRSGFTDREASALLGTLATLESDAVVNVQSTDDFDRKDKKSVSKTRGKMGRTTAGASTNKPLVDMFNTADGDEEPDVDKFEGDLEDFYIADGFGSRKEAYGKRASTAIDTANFNAMFTKLDLTENPETQIQATLMSETNTRVWVKKYGAERLTYLKDLSKAFYRITQVGGVYTGGKYAALLENKAPAKLE